MVSEVRIYVEGAGSTRANRTALRRGISIFLKSLIEEARARRIRWQIIACGSREDTFRDFSYALIDHAHAFNVLLVDSESAVRSQIRKEHLQNIDGWNLSDIDDEQCHLMVQSMETWLIADKEVLKRYYGQGFLENRLPTHSRIEEVNPSQLFNALQAATEQTQKGRYNKTKHSFELLGMIDSNVVREACPHCNILFEVLGEQINSS